MPAVIPLEPIVVLTHDYHPRSPLFSYTPVPSEHLKWGEVLAIKTFGALLKDIRSPRHHYFASWRAPDPEGFGRAGEDKPPRQSNLIPSDRGRMISG